MSTKCCEISNQCRNMRTYYSGVWPVRPGAKFLQLRCCRCFGDTPLKCCETCQPGPTTAAEPTSEVDAPLLPPAKAVKKRPRHIRNSSSPAWGTVSEYFSDDEEVGAAPVESVAGPTTPPRHQKMSATPQLHTPRSKVPKQDLEANEEADDAPASQKATQERGCRSGMHTDADPESTTAKALDPQLKNEANLTDHSNSSQ
mmetsp:Transcript_86678/g.140583  ORF Transcript_86678/g.140583 Transcript_86678/m.140583 type:complete len:200 (+) Transcript_86678:172-771(+)